VMTDSLIVSFSPVDFETSFIASDQATDTSGVERHLVLSYPVTVE
jgi:hypothetical protein